APPGIREMLRVRDVPAGWAAAAGPDGYLNGQSPIRRQPARPMPWGVRMATFRPGLRERKFAEAGMKTRSPWIAALFAAALMIISAAGSAASGAVPAAAGPAPEEPDITVAAIPAV